jgi:hypothetical protein
MRILESEMGILSPAINISEASRHVFQFDPLGMTPQFVVLRGFLASN